MTTEKKTTFKVGDGVLTNTFWCGIKRGVIVEIASPEHSCSPGMLLDFKDYNANNQHKPGRMWLIREYGWNLTPDPEGPFAPLRPFTCTNKGKCCYDNREYQKGVTALPHCPQCGSEIQYQDEKPNHETKTI